MKFLKKGKVEMFYSEFFGDIVLSNQEVYSRLSSHASSLLLSKLAEKLIYEIKSRGLDKTTDDTGNEQKFEDRELYGLQYIAGYVIHTLYNKLKYKTINPNQEVLSLLLTMKGTEENLNDAKLIVALTRGGLWAVKKEAEKIFVIAEKLFRKLYCRQ